MTLAELNVGDRIEVEIEKITKECVSVYRTAGAKPMMLYKLKNIPMYFCEEDFSKIVEESGK